MPTANSEADFWRHVRKTDKCWIWTGGKSGRRYGKFNLRGAHLKAHRFAYEYLKGPIPEGLHVLHSCDNGLCVNPKHLFVGTHVDNMKDRTAKHRERPLKGEANHLAKLTAEKVIEIRKKYSEGERQVDIANQFQIDQTHVSKIVTRLAWKHI